MSMKVRPCMLEAFHEDVHGQAPGGREGRQRRTAAWISAEVGFSRSMSTCVLAVTASRSCCARGEPGVLVGSRAPGTNAISREASRMVSRVPRAARGASGRVEGRSRRTQSGARARQGAGARLHPPRWISSHGGTPCRRAYVTAARRKRRRRSRRRRAALVHGSARVKLGVGNQAKRLACVEIASIPAPHKNDSASGARRRRDAGERASAHWSGASRRRRGATAIARATARRGSGCRARFAVVPWSARCHLRKIRGSQDAGLVVRVHHAVVVEADHRDAGLVVAQVVAVVVFKDFVRRQELDVHIIRSDATPET